MPQNIYVISDGTGRTAELTLKSALVQFENTDVEILLFPNIRCETQVNEVICEAYKTKSLICYTIVSKRLRHYILEQSRLFDLTTIDFMGPILAQLSNHFCNPPSEKPGLFNELNEAYFQRIDSIEFTLKHDDGLRINEIDKAEIVLLGVSRTFKTPLSVYLAFKGWKVANVPIVLDIPIPDIVFKLPHERVFCLTTNSTRLSELRKTRSSHLNNLTGDYSRLPHVNQELKYAQKIYNKYPKWTLINVTNKPIEEISSEIIRKMRKKARN